MNYYYLAASLPMLSLDDPPRITSAALREYCADHLDAGDMAALDSLFAEDAAPPRHAFLKRWHSTDALLRNVVVQLRAARRQRDGQPYLRDTDDYDADLEQGVTEAFAQQNPIERERAIDTLRWNMIESLAGLNPFSGEAILAYALKLRLAERWAGLDVATGQGAVEALVARQPAKKEDAS